jgi:hypothetical protein
MVTVAMQQGMQQAEAVAATTVLVVRALKE